MNNKLNNIIFIGNSGVGKTTLSKKLYKIINFNLIDIDSEIEFKLNLKIENIFEKYGEKYFRSLETEIIKNIIKKKYEKYVISTGAGIINSKNNRNILKNIGTIIYLKNNIKNLFNRLLNLNNKPIMKKNKKEIENIFKIREKLYEKIYDIKIDTENKNLEEIIKDILKILKIKNKI